MNNEQRLISKIIRERNIVPALQRKVNAADSIRAHISHTRLRKGKLTPAEDKRFTDMLDQLNNL